MVIDGVFLGFFLLSDELSCIIFRSPVGRLGLLMLGSDSFDNCFNDLFEDFSEDFSEDFFDDFSEDFFDDFSERLFEEGAL